MRSRVMLPVTLVLAWAWLAVAAAAPLRDGIPPAISGLIVKESGVIIYVETDSRHVVAISPDGAILWRTDPFIDSGLRPYREARPIIVSIEPCAPYAKDMGPKVCIRYSSSQFGELDIATGAFTFGGQD